VTYYIHVGILHWFSKDNICCWTLCFSLLRAARLFGIRGECGWKRRLCGGVCGLRTRDLLLLLGCSDVELLKLLFGLHYHRFYCRFYWFLLASSKMSGWDAPPVSSFREAAGAAGIQYGAVMMCQYGAVMVCPIRVKVWYCIGVFYRGRRDT
jgi:hypothetical protein